MNRAALLLDGVLNSVTCGVLIADENLDVIRLNRSGELITGWTEAEAKGKNCCDVLRSLTDSEICPLKICLTEGRQTEEQTLQLRQKNGDLTTVRVVSQILRDDHGQFIGGIQTFGDLSTVHDLRMRLERQTSFQGIIAQNHHIRDLFKTLPRLAESQSTVLIRGESGTGKELFAKALHALSPRKEGPFVAVNCAALPDTLLESELFGVVKGAFTDAYQDREGRIHSADGGTLFLDEIGDLTPLLQVKLLRFLQERRYSPLGSNREVEANVRVISATNRPLEAMIERGTFREDFYYRLNVLALEIPPLRERMEDVPILANHFLRNWSVLNNHPQPNITPTAIRALMAHDYPGNVRELENIIERAAVLAVDDTIDLSNLPDALRQRIQTRSKDEADSLMPSSRFTPVELAERETIREILEEETGNRLITAERLGLSRTTLWRKLKKYGLG